MGSKSCMAMPSLAFFLIFLVPFIYGQLVPALYIFGDSAVDVGNNNRIPTLIKANFPPYGRDFENHLATGRFCNGRLAMDILAHYLSFSSSPPAYLSREAVGNNLINGANFASAASGYYEPTAELYHSLSLRRQIAYYKEYQARLEELVGSDNATTRFSRGIHILSTGNSDFLQNYYINPLLNNALTPGQFSDILIQNFANFVQELYDLGARKVGVTSLPPIGCLPAAITLFGSGNNMCVDRLNHDAYSFNQKLRTMSRRLQRRLSDLNLIVFDIYKSLDDIIKNPVEHGFAETREGCCGTGMIETSILCNRLAIGTCHNASEYVFWDAFHPSDAANDIIANNILDAGGSFLS